MAADCGFAKTKKPDPYGEAAFVNVVFIYEFTR